MKTNKKQNQKKTMNLYVTHEKHVTIYAKRQPTSM